MRQQSAGVIVYHQDKKNITYLLLKYEAGHWDFPKGHIEKGETQKEAALRELQEETGLTVALLQGFEASLEYCFKNKDKKLVFKTVYFFVGKSNSQDTKLSFEHLDYTWLPFKEAYEQLTFKNAQEVLGKAQRFIEKK